MMISMRFLIIGVLHLLSLIAVLYMAAFSKTHHGVRFPAVDALLLLVQLMNLTILPQLIMSGNGTFAAVAGNERPLFAAQCVLLAFVFARLLWLIRKAVKRRNELLIPRAVRETIDHLPGGLCFATPSGKPILTNHKMNDLVYKLTGQTVISMQSVWEELNRPEPANGCARPVRQWLDGLQADGLQADGLQADSQNNDSPDVSYILYPDGRIWRFSKKALADRQPHYIQLEATDITDLYRYTKELFENNQRLAEQNERLQSILANIVEINREKEIISAKMRIHDELGRSILTTKRHLSNQTLEGNIQGLIELWGSTIRGLEDYALTGADEETSPETELMKAADLIGCQIRFDGDRPNGRDASLLLYALVRESLTNAVRHAGANLLNVAISPTERGYHVEITDNGTDMPPGLAENCSPAEGSGLRNLRRRLEQEGASLVVKHDGGGICLIAELPSERKTAVEQED